MRKIAPLTFKFVYVETSTGQARVKNAYRKIFERAKQNILMQKDILNRDMRIVDSVSEMVQTDGDARRIVDDSGNGNEVKTFQRDDLSNDKTESNSGSQSGNEVADKQSVFNEFIRTSQ